MSQNKVGFLTFAQNFAPGNTVDYLKLAYLQALNCKSTHPNFGTAVIVDFPTFELVEDKHRKAFDYIIRQPMETVNPMGNEWQAYFHTPFHETIKVESDLLFTRNIEHWLPALRLKGVVLSTGCKTYKSEISNSRFYRKFFDDNDLPDVYNGLMYFRHSEEAEEFFTLAKDIFFDWKNIKEQAVLNCREDSPSTDVLYALAAQMFGRERCTLPTHTFFNFVHMKTRIQGLAENQPWYDTVMAEQDGDIIRINNLNQLDPVHYYNKDFATDELISYYEQRIGIS